MMRGLGSCQAAACELELLLQRSALGLILEPGTIEVSQGCHLG